MERKLQRLSDTSVELICRQARHSFNDYLDMSKRVRPSVRCHCSVLSIGAAATDLIQIRQKSTSNVSDL
eukprot:762833-Hanusia_phi.AAC.2